MTNSKVQVMLKKSLIILLYSLVITCVGCFIAYIISKQTTATFQDVMTYVGFALLIIGGFSSMKGNPSGISFRGIGQKNVNAVTLEELEYTRHERELTNYHKNFRKNSIVVFSSFSSVLIISGILVMLLSYLLFI